MGESTRRPHEDDRPVPRSTGEGSSPDTPRAGARARGPPGLEAAREVDAAGLPVDAGRDDAVVARHGGQAGRAGSAATGRRAAHAAVAEHEPGAAPGARRL